MQIPYEKIVNCDVMQRNEVSLEINHDDIPTNED